MTSELSLWDRNFLTLSNSALVCSPSLLSRLITCLGLSTTAEGLVGGKCTWDPRDVDDMVELQESVEGHGEGGVAKDLFKSGLSVPESMLVRLVRVTEGEDDVEESGGWGGGLFSTTSISWMLSWRAA